MEDTNSVIMVGRLTRDAETKYTNSGLAICNFSIANNRRKKEGDDYVDTVSFFDCVLFGKTAENLGQYLEKGKQVLVNGNLVQDRWEDNEGNKRNKTSIVVYKLQFFGGKKEQSDYV